MTFQKQVIGTEKLWCFLIGPIGSVGSFLSAAKIYDIYTNGVHRKGVLPWNMQSMVMIIFYLSIFVFSPLTMPLFAHIRKGTMCCTVYQEFTNCRSDQVYIEFIPTIDSARTSYFAH